MTESWWQLHFSDCDLFGISLGHSAAGFSCMGLFGSGIADMYYDASAVMEPRRHGMSGLASEPLWLGSNTAPAL